MKYNSERAGKQNSDWSSVMKRVSQIAILLLGGALSVVMMIIMIIMILITNRLSRQFQKGERGVAKS